MDTSLKRRARYALSVLFVFQSLSSHADPESLPLLCTTALRIVLPEGRELSNAERERLYTLALQSGEERAKALAKLTPEQLFEVARLALFANWELEHREVSKIPGSLLPNDARLREAFPWLKTGPMPSERVKQGFQKAVLGEGMRALAIDAGLAIGERATPEQKRKYFALMMNELTTHGVSWYHQTRVDKVIDGILGSKAEEITGRLKARDPEEVKRENGGEETYSTAGNTMLLTTYYEMRDILRHVDPKPGSVIVDLGSGFGRVGVFAGIMYPHSKFYGYEIVKDRSAEGRRQASALGIDSHVKNVEQNLADPSFKPEAADVYYAFNPVRGETFDKILNDLKEVGLKSGKRFKLVVTGPAPYEKTDGVPWLRQLKHDGPPSGQFIKIYEFVPEVAELEKHVPEHPAFRRLTEKDEPMIDAYYQKDHPTFSLFTRNSLFSWNPLSKFEVARIGKQLVVRFSDGPEKGMVIEPMGGTVAEKAKIISDLLSAKQTTPSQLGYLSRPVIDALAASGVISAPHGRNGERTPASLAQSPPSLTAELRTDLSDYLYRREDLVDLNRTKRQRERAGQARRFFERNPDVVSVPVPDKGDLSRNVKAFGEKWGKERISKMRDIAQAGGQGHPEEQIQKTSDELDALKRLEERMGPKSVKLALMNSKTNEILAYAFGEAVPLKTPFSDQPQLTFVLYVQKALSTDTNVYQAMNLEIAKAVLADPRFQDVKYFNLMDDWGNKGLRQFKEGYSPIGYGDNYTISRKD